MPLDWSETSTFQYMNDYFNSLDADLVSKHELTVGSNGHTSINWCLLLVRELLDLFPTGKFYKKQQQKKKKRMSLCFTSWFCD